MVKTKRRTLHTPALTDRITIQVRFSEVDSMLVAWHGSYVMYLEDGREAFGKRYQGIGYEDYFRERMAAPIVNMNIDYKLSLRSGEKAIVETRYIPCEGAKIMLEYVIYRESDMAVVATASTLQVFTSLDTGEMQYVCPDFYTQWKERWLPKE